MPEIPEAYKDCHDEITNQVEIMENTIYPQQVEDVGEDQARHDFCDTLDDLIDLLDEVKKRKETSGETPPGGGDPP